MNCLIEISFLFALFFLILLLLMYSPSISSIRYFLDLFVILNQM